ncbi:MAG TPA: cytochrome C [Nitrospiraceae bacterium]|jgi:cytochrome b subunit of formate dehydrogenase|nr:cytochrome C [Nitrospiraceae bacterium]
MGGDKSKGDYMRRFSFYRMAEHWLLAVIFVILVVTGLSQKFYGLDISQRLVMYLGGIDFVRLIHRGAGLFLAFLLIEHIFVASFGILFRKWEPLIMITKKDFIDASLNLKYYLGVTSHPAYCDRYNYKQKFEYWGILTGLLVMMATGAVLWFPVAFTRFLPGEIIPAAKVMHSNEAFLIFLIITLWHIYNAVFNPEIFPLDTSILTGYISRERMVREHPAELARIEGKQLDEIIHSHHERGYQEKVRFL